MNARALLATAKRLAGAAHANGAKLIVNERFDVALAATAHGVHLNATSVQTAAVRCVTGNRCLIGYSAHASTEAGKAEADGADYVFLGTIWPSASHPGGAAAGTQLIRDTGLRIPLIAIGGVTPTRTGEAMEYGAYGVAVIGGVWNAMDPAAAVKSYLDEMQVRK